MNLIRLSLYYLALCMTVSFASCTAEQSIHQLSSPEGKLELEVMLNSDGSPAYTLKYNGNVVIDTSLLGIDFSAGKDWLNGMSIESVSYHKVDEQWEMPWGEQRNVINRANEMRVNLSSSEGDAVPIHFRLYQDGLAFRYGLGAAHERTIVAERSEFNLTGDHTCWWIPGDWDIYEHLYTESSFTGIDATAKRDHGSLAQTYIPENAVSTPMTMKTANGLYLSFHEAALTDYSDMTLRIDAENLKMTSALVGGPEDYLVSIDQANHVTPWRVVMVAERAGDLIESNIIVNLNEPSVLEDISYFQPTKYAGIWWDMHIGTKTWDKASGRHGATTEYAKKMIDFAAEAGLGAVLVEGWNEHWEGWFGDSRPLPDGPFDFVTSYDDYDLAEVVRYGKEKGVDLIMHHETSAMPAVYEHWMDSAFALMQSHDIHSVKTGYVGQLIPKGYYHHGQYMVRHYRKVLETAAKYDVAVNAHEPIKATGIRRTYPNAVAREGLRGQEFNAWASDGGNNTEHLTVVPFTRMLGGPIDFTPGVFELELPTKPNNRINTTLTHQLGSYVVLYGPLQMAPDLPDNYRARPEALQFITDVGVNWEQSKVIDGEPGDFCVISREERDTGNWFMGACNSEESRSFELNFDFLGEGEYAMRMYSDADNADWKSNPYAMEIKEETVTASTPTRQIYLAPGGGMAASFHKK